MIRCKMNRGRQWRQTLGRLERIINVPDIFHLHRVRHWPLSPRKPGLYQSLYLLCLSGLSNGHLLLMFLEIGCPRSRVSGACSCGKLRARICAALWRFWWFPVSLGCPWLVRRSFFITGHRVPVLRPLFQKDADQVRLGLTPLQSYPS